MSRNWKSILTAISHLPLREDTNLPKVRERQREKEVIRRRLAALVEDSDAMRACLKESIAHHQWQQGKPAQF
jgi:(1->4)-alpha-D-glucan 1-alpha-D-glucosylmutase